MDHLVPTQRSPAEPGTPAPVLLDLPQTLPPQGAPHGSRGSGRRRAASVSPITWAMAKHTSCGVSCTA